MRVLNTITKQMLLFGQSENVTQYTVFSLHLLFEGERKGERTGYFATDLFFKYVYLNSIEVTTNLGKYYGNTKKNG